MDGIGFGGLTLATTPGLGPVPPPLAQCETLLAAGGLVVIQFRPRVLDGLS
jgi:hypothetical protein